MKFPEENPHAVCVGIFYEIILAFFLSFDIIHTLSEGGSAW